MLGPVLILSLGLVDVLIAQFSIGVTAFALDDLELVKAVGDGQSTFVDCYGAGV